MRAALAPGERETLVGAGALVGLAVVLGLWALSGTLRWALGWWWRRRGRALPGALSWGLTGGLGLLGAGLLLAPLREGRGEALTATAAVGGGGPDLVLVTLDTLRADHVGAIGGARRAVSTPNLDRLANEGALFTRGVSPVPLTLPAHAAMLSGQHPLELGLLRNGMTVPVEATLVAPTLRAAGYRTGAFVSAAVLRGKTGIAEGFERFDDRFSTADRLAGIGLLKPVLSALELLPRERRGDETMSRALDWLQAGDGRPTFLWIHLYDCHAPYRPPAPYDAQYAWDSPDAQGNPEEMRAAREAIRSAHQVFSPFIPFDLRAAVARYAGEVSFVDALVGRLLAALPAETRLVVAADHGESLTEHGELVGHGSQVYDTTTRAPIWVRGPEVAAGSRVETPVPLEAVGATLRALTGHATGEPSLLDALTAPWPALPLTSFAGTQQSQDAIPIQKGWEVARVDYNTKWISRKDGTPERYAPTLDPGELNDLASGAPEPERAGFVAEAEQIRGRLIDIAALPAPVDPETSEELRALGYTE